MTDTTAKKDQHGSRTIRAFRSLRDRRMGAMLILAFAASLPFGAVVGVLTAWLTKEGIDRETIGVLSLVSIGYAFKYLWAPLFQRAHNVPILKIGGRRSWLVTLQIIISLLLAVLAFSNPPENIGLVALIAFAITLLAPTHDLILDAWRIEVARSDEEKDLMSALYQFGYKSGGFVSGFVALLIAARFGWVVSYIMMASFMALCVLGSLLAPEPAQSAHKSTTRMSFLPSIPQKVAGPAVLIVSLSWIIGFFLIGSFVITFFTGGDGLSGRTFVRDQGPLIVFLTVIVPALTAAYLVVAYKADMSEISVQQAGSTRAQALVRTLFQAVFDPFMDLIFRLRGWAILVLLLALTYRFTDAVWGSFAYPFYLGIDQDALGHSLDDVAIASKFFGVIATILGSLLGAILIASIGRMPVMFIGGIVAAVTNLLYADLAAGAAALDSFLSFTRLDIPLVAFAEFAATIQPDDVALDPNQGQKMARLMITIFAENIAGGLALVAITAYLTSVVNPRFAAVQYALLASLTMLIGTLGRPWLGEIIDERGFYDVFIITFWLGGIAVALCGLEWWRQSRDPSAGKSLILGTDKS